MNYKLFLSLLSFVLYLYLNFDKGNIGYKTFFFNRYGFISTPMFYSKQQYTQKYKRDQVSKEQVSITVGIIVTCSIS